MIIKIKKIGIISIIILAFGKSSLKSNDFYANISETEIKLKLLLNIMFVIFDYYSVKTFTHEIL